MSEKRPVSGRTGRILILSALALAGLLVAGRIASALYVELLWFDEVGYSHVFWKRALWEWGTRLVATLIATGLVLFNLRIVASTLGGIQIKRRFGDLEISEHLPRR